LPADFSKYEERVLRFVIRFLGASNNSLQSVISTQCEKSFLKEMECAAEQNETAFFPSLMNRDASLPPDV
jgi:hypothetical protein